MSIFGKKSSDFETVRMHIRDLHKRVRLDLNNRVTEFQQKIDKDRLVIFAESRGSLEENEVFSFGNGGRTNGVGYVLPRKGHILGIGLSSSRLAGEITVGVSVNGHDLPFCEITLYAKQSKYESFAKPFELEAGDIINFVNKTGNATTENTVVSLLIELF